MHGPYSSRLVAFCLLPALFELLAREALGVDIEIQPFDHRRFAALLESKVLEPPLALPSSNVVQLWHECFDSDPDHVWLRGAVARAAAELTGPGRST